MTQIAKNLVVAVNLSRPRETVALSDRIKITSVHRRTKINSSNPNTRRFGFLRVRNLNRNPILSSLRKMQETPTKDQMTLRVQKALKDRVVEETKAREAEEVKEEEEVAEEDGHKLTQIWNKMTTLPMINRETLIKVVATNKMSKE